MKIGLVVVGGAIGALARYAIGALLPAPAGSLPWATFGINLLGSFLLGVLMAVVTSRLSAPADEYVRLFFGIGLLGAFTTFSTFEFETYALLTSGNPLTAIIYVSLSVVGGLCCVWLGLSATRLW